MTVRPRRLVVVGSILVDVIVWVEDWPERGADTLARAGSATPGGAMNVITAARRLGLDVVYGGLVGEGPFGDTISKALSDLGVSSLTAHHPKGDSGFDVAVVEADGERTFLTHPGAEAHLTPGHLASLGVGEGDAVYVSGYDLTYPDSGPSLAAWIPKLKDGVFVVLDPGPLVDQIPTGILETVLGRTDLLTLNHREGTLLSGKADPEAGIPSLLARVRSGGCVVWRVGKDGAWVAGSDRSAVLVPAVPARAVDTTGAGDVHTAALVARLTAGRGLKEAVREANAAAAFAVQREGPSESPTLEELQLILTKRGDLPLA